MTAWRSKHVVFYDYSVIYYLITLYIVALTSFIRYISCRYCNHYFSFVKCLTQLPYRLIHPGSSFYIVTFFLHVKGADIRWCRNALSVFLPPLVFSSLFSYFLSALPSRRYFFISLLFVLSLFLFITSSLFFFYFTSFSSCSLPSLRLPFLPQNAFHSSVPWFSALCF